MGFSGLDYAVLAAYLVGITVFGSRFRHSHRSVKDYFLGRRRTSWIVISLSIVATETSTLTLIGASVPGLPHLWLWSIVIVGVLTLVYTFEGGIAAVIWTDLVQLVIYVSGSLLAAYMLLQLVPGGWPSIVADARAAGKLQFISWSWDVTVPFTFWAGLIGGCFLDRKSVV